MSLKMDRDSNFNSFKAQNQDFNLNSSSFIQRPSQIGSNVWSFRQVVEEEMGMSSWNLEESEVKQLKDVIAM